MDESVNIRNEISTRLNILQQMMEKHAADGILLRRVSSFAWATLGLASYVNTAASEGAASLLLTKEGAYLLTNNIEAARLEAEGNVEQQPWQLSISPWQDPQRAYLKLSANKKLIADGSYPGCLDLSYEFNRLRAALNAVEAERMRFLGGLCARILHQSALAVRPGMSEYEIAAIVGSEAQKKGVLPIVNLIATDERIFHFRHPLPTGKKLERYALLVLSGRWQGLVCSISRLIHFGELPQSLMEIIKANAIVNTAMIASTRPGNSLAGILAVAQDAYSRCGYADEWLHHHQGGAVGYEPREFLATPTSSDQVSAGQAYAWNPTIAGSKMEDTILVGSQKNEILTFTPDWPLEWIRFEEYDDPVPCALALQLD